MTVDPFGEVLGFGRGTDQPRVLPDAPLPLTSHVARLFASASHRDINQALKELRDLDVDEWVRHFLTAPIVLAATEVTLDFVVLWVEGAIGEVDAHYEWSEPHEVHTNAVGRFLVSALQEEVARTFPYRPSIGTLFSEVAGRVVAEALADTLKAEDEALALDLLDEASREELDARLLRLYDHGHTVSPDLCDLVATQAPWSNALGCALELIPKPVDVDYSQPPSGLSVRIDWRTFSRTLIDDLVTVADADEYAPF
jgi:hypothetical protein